MNHFINYYHKQNVWTICFYTVLLLFIENATFPFFNNVDEYAHFDLIIKHSQGNLSTKESKSFSEESMRLISLYDSPEYFYRPEYYESKQIPPPVYYSLAAIWYQSAKLMEMKEGDSIYWIRFLNVFIYLFILAGFFLSFAFLSKVANIPLVFTYALIILFYIKKILSLKSPKRNYYYLLFFVISSLFPVSHWIFYNWIVLGDLMGTSNKIHGLGWTLKLISEIFNHPIFAWSSSDFRKNQSTFEFISCGFFEQYFC